MIIYLLIVCVMEFDVFFLLVDRMMKLFCCLMYVFCVMMVEVGNMIIMLL